VRLSVAGGRRGGHLEPVDDEGCLIFGNDWDKAEATIVARDMTSSGDGATTTYTYVADVSLEYAEQRRRILDEI